MMIRLVSNLSQRGRPYHELAISVPRRTFYPAKFSDRLIAERAHDALLVYFTRAGVSLEGKPFNPDFYDIVDSRLKSQSESLAALIGIRTEARGENFTERVNCIISYVQKLKEEPQKELQSGPLEPQSISPQELLSKTDKVKKALVKFFVEHPELEVFEGTSVHLHKQIPSIEAGQIRDALTTWKQQNKLTEDGICIWTIHRSDFII